MCHPECLTGSVDFLDTTASGNELSVTQHIVLRYATRCYMLCDPLVVAALTRRSMQREIAGVQYYSTATVLERAAVTRQTLWRWRRERRIPSGHRFRNGQVLFTHVEFEEILAYANRVEPDALNPHGSSGSNQRSVG